MVEEKSITQKVWGFFTFINIIWLLSLVGILVAAVPACMYLFEPVIKAIFEKFKDFMVWVIKKVVIPFVTFLHNWGVFEVIFYLVAF